ncbi:hypothetical protein [Actinomadura rupiterrae]|uniref:hypothetical protein n=1 Tax=Actinomadura rupiterrae TaxID=559627 RepID=UPI0020A2C92F|nr:hypothetical protein [Actinomadura rupiterrae]MCP2343157.1 hypothetical protein [Actinomadura rupiterrae]
MHAEADDEAHYGQWRASLAALIATPEALMEWQNRRYRFAHAVGRMLADPACGQPALQGPVLYGVYLSGVGLAYVGQTSDARRRLKDLPIGESHHLGMTVPPELWEKVVVIQWPVLVPTLAKAHQRAVSSLGTEVVGLALEHLVQVDRRPPLNARKRALDGTWRDRRLETSKSRGATHAQLVAPLHQAVSDAWQALETAQCPESMPPVQATPAGRAVFPSKIIDRERHAEHWSR